MVKAGLLPALNEERNKLAQEGDASQTSSWFIPKKILRPGTNPAAALRSLLITELPGVRLERERGSTAAGLIGQWRKTHPEQKLLLVIDQFEEIITLCHEEKEREDFINELMQALEDHPEVLRMVLTLRSDFEAQISQNSFKDWWQEDNRFMVPPMTQDELREVIEQPASVMVLYFEPRELVDRLINEVIQTPGALPLLSFTLSELYRRYIERQKDIEQQDGNRALTEADYEAIGGVIGSLRRRIDNEYEQLPDAAHKETMKRILLRMVAFEGGELTRRRVPKRELVYPDTAENERVRNVLERLFQVRLIVGGKSENTGGEAESYVEPAHDALIVAWDKLLGWRAEEEEAILLQRQLTQAAVDWEGTGKKEKKRLLWNSNPRLLRAQEILEEKNVGNLQVGKRHGLLGLVKQFYRVLRPSFRELDQTVWLNQVETAFVRRSIERKRNWIGGVTLSILAVIIVLAAAWWNAQQQRNKAQEQEKIAVEQKKKAVSEEKRAVSALKKANYNLAKVFEKKAAATFRETEKEGNSAYQQTVLFASVALELDKSALEPDAIGRLFVFRAGLAELAVFRKHDSGVNSASFSPDGRRIVSASNDTTVRLWDVASDKELAKFEHDSGVNSASFSPDGRRVVSASNDTTVRLWDVASGKELAKFEHDFGVNSAAFSPDGKTIVSVSRDDSVRLWDIASHNQTMLKGASKTEWLGSLVYSAAFTPDGRIVSASDNTTIRFWDVASGKKLPVYLKDMRILSAAWHSVLMVAGLSQLLGIILCEYGRWSGPCSISIVLAVRRSTLTAVSLSPPQQIPFGSGMRRAAKNSPSLKSMRLLSIAQRSILTTVSSFLLQTTRPFGSGMQQAKMSWPSSNMRVLSTTRCSVLMAGASFQHQMTRPFDFGTWKAAKNSPSSKGIRKLSTV